MFAYGWKRCDLAGANCVALGPFAAASYTIQPSDAGSTLRATVTATNGGGNQTATSAATAPIEALAPPGTLGNTTVGSSSNLGWGGFIDTSGPYTLSAASSVLKMSGYVRGGSASEDIRTVIYADGGTNNPGNLVAVSKPTTIAANQAPGWVDFNFDGTPVLPAGTYWLGYWYSTTSVREYYTTSANAGRYRAVPYSPTADPVSPYGTSAAYDVSFSLYAVVQTGGPGAGEMLGRTAVGGRMTRGGANFLDVSGPYAVSAAVRVSKFSGFLAGGSVKSALRAVVYADEGGSPGGLVGVSDEVTVGASAPPGWVDFVFPVRWCLVRVGTGSVTGMAVVMRWSTTTLSMGVSGTRRLRIRRPVRLRVGSAWPASPAAPTPSTQASARPTRNPARAAAGGSRSRAGTVRGCGGSVRRGRRAGVVRRASSSGGSVRS